MTKEQFYSLVKYIDAAIEEATDNCNASDGGLISSIAKSTAQEELYQVLVYKEEELK